MKFLHMRNKSIFAEGENLQNQPPQLRKRRDGSPHRGRCRYLTAVLLAAVLCCSCAKGGNPTEPTDPTESTAPIEETTAATVASDPDPTPADPEEEQEDLPEKITLLDPDGKYDYADTVGGAPVDEYGIYRGDGDKDAYTPDDPEAPDGDSDGNEGYYPAPGKDDSDPTPDPTPDPTDPTDPTPDPEPVIPEPDPNPAPEDVYGNSIAAFSDYTADVKFLCVSTLSDGSESRYPYAYRVQRTGQEYTADYQRRGQAQTATFSADTGRMVTPDAQKTAELTDFYRFCSMLEPIPLSAYFYESSAQGTQISARVPADGYRALLLNTSGLFYGFEKLPGDQLKMGSLDYRALLSADGALKSCYYSFSFTVEDSILGVMEFDVSVEVNYVEA